MGSSCSRRRLGGLDTLFRGEGSGPAIVLLHGYAAGEDGIAQGARLLQVPPGGRLYLPLSPLILPDPQGGHVRAWWPLDVERIAAIEVGQDSLAGFLTGPQPGIGEARGHLLTFLAAVREKEGAERIVLGGISQGAMLSVEVALSVRQPLSGLALMSGAPIHLASWRARLPQALPAPRWQCHGLQDGVIPFPLGADLAQLLAPKYPGPFLPFQGGHELNPKMLRLLGEQLRAWLDRPVP